MKAGIRHDQTDLDELDITMRGDFSCRGLCHKQGLNLMREPTQAQVRKLYELCHTLTNVMFQPVHVVRLDERTGNLFILAGREETIEFEVNSQGEIVDE